jgi:hypothetical protein
MLKHLVLATALLGACSDDPIFSASVDHTSGAFDDFDGCSCMVYNADHEVQFDCTDNITMYAPIGPLNVLYSGSVDFQYSKDYTIYFGGGFGVFELGPLYPDPRGEPFTGKYHSFFVKRVILPDQSVCDPLYGDCISFPASKLEGGKIYCRDSEAGL